VQLTHVRLLVDDFAACFAFYRDVLGLEVTSGTGEGGYASFATGDASLSIFERSEQGEVVRLREPGDDCIPILEVDDVDAAVERLREHVLGPAVSRPDWGIRVAYLRDPAGNLLELAQGLARE
jgi:lactoylglutathione lyase